MKLNIALVGCDTSHSYYFSRLLNDETDPQHIAGARVVAAVTDGYGTIDGSREKALKHSAQINAEFGIPLFESIEELPPVDAIFIENTDGARHLEQLQQAAKFKVPVFIDKPLALCSEDAEAIFQLGREQGIPLMSSSALRYDSFFTTALKQANGETITGADIYGCTEMLDGCPGFFWYGIHSAEMLFAAMGPGFEEVQVAHQRDYDLITGIWNDGRIGTIRGTRRAHFAFGGTLHTAAEPIPFAVPEDVSFYGPLLEKIVQFVKTGVSPIAVEETLEIVRFLESANKALAANVERLAVV